MLCSCTWMSCTLQGGNACVSLARARIVFVNDRQGDVRVSDALTGVEEEKDVVMRISATSCFSPSNATCIGVCPFLFWEDKDTFASHCRRLHGGHLKRPHVSPLIDAARAICSIVSWREAAATAILQKSLRIELKEATLREGFAP
jgi:hypothetical protein